jgi:predicted ATP-dependent serine protease
MAFKAPRRRKPENVWKVREEAGDNDGGTMMHPTGYGAPEHEVPVREEDPEPDEPLQVIAHDLDDVEPSDDERLPSGHPIFDAITCGGPVMGTASGLTSFPGVGKSTLLLDVAYAYRAKGKKVVYLSLEEPSKKVSRRARRLKLKDKYAPKLNKKTGKAFGFVKIISPLDLVEGETDQERERRLETGFSLTRLLEIVDPTIDVLILDSASTCYDPEIEGVRDGTRQIKNIGRLFYERCGATGHYLGTKACVGICVLQSTKMGDSAVPQAFTHYIDATYIGEHVEHDGSKVIACRDQKKGTGFIAFRSHGKNRDGNITAIAYAKMTAEGLIPCDHDDVLPAQSGGDDEVKKAAKAARSHVDTPTTQLQGVETTMEGLPTPKRKR